MHLASTSTCVGWTNKRDLAGLVEDSGRGTSASLRRCHAEASLIYACSNFLRQHGHSPLNPCTSALNAVGWGSDIIGSCQNNKTIRKLFGNRVLSTLRGEILSRHRP